MRGLTAKEILGVWEVGQQQMPAERALTLLSTFCPQTARDDLERLSIGRRDALLLSMRELLFGSQFSGKTRCPLTSTFLPLNAGSIWQVEKKEAKSVSARPFTSARLDSFVNPAGASGFLLLGCGL